MLQLRGEAIALLLLSATSGIGMMACASSHPTGPIAPPARPVRLTSAEVVSHRVGNREASESADASTSAQYREALSRAENAILMSPNTPWPYYNRAVALRYLNRTDDAVAAFRDAEARFGERERWGKSIAIYGRARVLDDANRCPEAREAYAQYAKLVAPSNPQAANLAIDYGNECNRPTQGAIDAAKERTNEMILDQDWDGVLALQNASPAASGDAWSEYNRAIALDGVGRTDEAVAAFDSAAKRFDTDLHGQTSALYGKARTLDKAKRCEEAEKAYQEFADTIRTMAPKSADMALEIAQDCKTH
ncbi:tetratricopeptide TPR_2 [Labilithrix luteola]|uniref:Tetratricopeptide TPR_2 n=1 Tax=Labilithrix luteola TaxID=1391654 RepID=A0A0K1PZ80_9BACT|nr:tetratricopeptide repeat protein [Labilithrix luteola]AKU98828.1 tetratricopeptide TPR_2 [Labilithrix luteola]